MDKIDPKYLQAVELIKTAILQSQYNAIRLANQEQLKLYFGIGRYISENSRTGYWGTGALEIISNQLKNDLPGLMGFGVTSLKNMRKFYEAWRNLESKSASALADLQITGKEAVKIRQVELPNSAGFPIGEFLAVPFTQHIRIIEGAKEREERLFYIRLTAISHLSEKAVIKSIKEDDYHHSGTLPNNFLNTIPDAKSARRALRAFKDEYLLDFINTEELDAGDIEDVDERVLENEIVDNIRDFILRFGQDFLFIKWRRFLNFNMQPSFRYFFNNGKLTPTRLPCKPVLISSFFVTFQVSPMIPGKIIQFRIIPDCIKFKNQKILIVF